MTVAYFSSVSIILLLAGCSPIERKNDQNEVKIGLTYEKRIADSFYDQNQYDSAIYYFSKLISNDSTMGEYYFKRGYSYSEIKKKTEARLDFEKAILLNFRVSDAYVNIGIDTMLSNDTIGLFYFKKALQADPNNAKAAMQIVFIEEYRKKMEKQRRKKHP